MNNRLTHEAIDLAKRYDSGEFAKGGPGSGQRGHHTDHPEGVTQQAHRALENAGFKHVSTESSPIGGHVNTYEHSNGDKMEINSVRHMPGFGSEMDSYRHSDSSGNLKDAGYASGSGLKGLQDHLKGQ